MLFDLRLTFSLMDSFFLDTLFSILLIDLLQLSSCSDKLVIRNYFQLPRTAINFNFWKTFIYANLSRFCDSQLLYRTFNRILIFRTTRRGATVQKRIPDFNFASFFSIFSFLSSFNNEFLRLIALEIPRQTEDPARKLAGNGDRRIQSSSN